jgi:hypothetical protein
MTHKKKKKVKKFHVLNCWMYSFEGCYQKHIIFQLKFFLNFWSSKPLIYNCIQIRIRIKSIRIRNHARILIATVPY